MGRTLGGCRGLWGPASGAHLLCDGVVANEYGEVLVLVVAIGVGGVGHSVLPTPLALGEVDYVGVHGLIDPVECRYVLVRLRVLEFAATERAHLRLVHDIELCGGYDTIRKMDRITADLWSVL